MLLLETGSPRVRGSMETDTNASEGHGADSSPTYWCPDNRRLGEASSLRVMYCEKLEWKWECSAVLLISGFKKKK